MSSSQLYSSNLTPPAKSLEGLEVYRCKDTHWHFVFQRNDNRSGHLPWYRVKVHPKEKIKFPRNTKVYVQGRGEESFTVDHKYVSGFYFLQESQGPGTWCMGEYGVNERNLYREEELSEIPWGSKDPPKYDDVGGLRPPGYSQLPIQ